MACRTDIKKLLKLKLSKFYLRRTMAKPKLVKDARLEIRLAEQELESLRAQAEERDLSVSDLVRHSLKLEKTSR